MTISDVDKLRKFYFIAILFNSALFLVHSILLTVFYIISIREMFYFNIFSVSLYALCFLLIYKRLLQAFVFSLILEIQLHLIVATILIGWDCGFPLYLFGLIMIIYYTKYIYCDKKYMRSIPLIVSITSILVFFLLRMHSYMQTPIYVLSQATIHRFFIFNSLLVFSLIMISLFDYTKIVLDNEQKLHRIADFDELTQIYTRRKIHEILQIYHKESEKGKQNFCISIIDVDNFKHINDTFGHDIGDYVLKTICQNIKASLSKDVRNYTDIARWGGDEFLIVQKYDGKSVSLDQCKNIIANIQNLISSYRFMSKDTRLPVSLTIGFASHCKGDSIDDTFKTADENLYKGKIKGKNTVVF